MFGEKGAFGIKTIRDSVHNIIQFDKEKSLSIAEDFVNGTVLYVH